MQPDRTVRGLVGPASGGRREDWVGRTRVEVIQASSGASCAVPPVYTTRGGNSEKDPGPPGSNGKAQASPGDYHLIPQRGLGWEALRPCMWPAGPACFPETALRPRAWGCTQTPDSCPKLEPFSLGSRSVPGGMGRSRKEPSPQGAGHLGPPVWRTKLLREHACCPKPAGDPWRWCVPVERHTGPKRPGRA